jgi:hypothetical protein
MSAFLLLLAVTGGFTAVAAGAWWLCCEGIRQGDDPDDLVTAVTLAARPGGELTVSVCVTNPAAIPVVASASSRWVGVLAPLSGSGRSTRRRYSKCLSDRLVAIDGHDTATVSWTVTSPTKRRRLLVDVYAWQQSDRLRRHRSVLLPRARLYAPASPGDRVR